MKKTVIVFLIALFILSACSSYMAVEGGGSVEIDLLPGDGTESDSQSESQTSQEDQIFRNPIVIGLLIMLGVVLLALLFRRPKQSV